MFEVYKNKKVLITGHTGFKGSWLAYWLNKLGANVAGFALPPLYENGFFKKLDIEERVQHNIGDLRSLNQIQTVIDKFQPEFIFHLAAQPLVRLSYEQPKITFDTNVGGAINLLESIKSCKSVKTLVFITSDKCYKNKEWVWGYRENDELGGYDPYSASKACAELIFSSYQHSYWNDEYSPSSATARAGNVIGGGDWSTDRIIPDCIKALSQNETIIIRSPDATRPWQHVLEPLGGYLLLASHLHKSNSNVIRGAWNFGPDKKNNRSVKELVEEVIKVWGSGVYNVDSPKAQKNMYESTLLHLNCDKAKHLLDWKPVWSFEESIYHTVNWYKALVENLDIQKITNSQIDEYMKKMKSIER